MGTQVVPSEGMRFVAGAWVTRLPAASWKTTMGKAPCHPNWFGFCARTAKRSSSNAEASTGASDVWIIEKP